MRGETQKKYSSCVPKTQVLIVLRCDFSHRQYDERSRVVVAKFLTFSILEYFSIKYIKYSVFWPGVLFCQNPSLNLAESPLYI